MYTEIKELYEYCRGLNIPCRLEPLFDGYKLVLPDGGDFIQHCGSYESSHCVEPGGIDDEINYMPWDLAEAKRLVKKYYGQKEN